MKNNVYLVIINPDPKDRENANTAIVYTHVELYCSIDVILGNHPNRTQTKVCTSREAAIRFAVSNGVREDDVQFVRPGGDLF